ncbi:MAG: prolyl oligopeptidase family serine peptidase [Planctomycetota bacterium]|nr:prolyl oligopeptidase family serine peptidase [Planctomycetota bacterium]
MPTEKTADRRDAALKAMQVVMGPLPGDERAVPLDAQFAEERAADGLVYRKVTFAVEPGDRAIAWLIHPEKLDRPAPALVCLHQTTRIGKDEPAGLGGLPNLHYALELARRGFVTLTPDYPNFGDYRVNVYRLGYASATMKAIWNHMRAVDFLEELPQVASGRIGAIGHSLGGHNTLFLAAFDRRIIAAVSSCGFTKFARNNGGDLSDWSHLGYMPRIATEHHTDPAQMPFDFTDVLAAIAPRPVFLNAPTRDEFDPIGVDECVAATAPLYNAAGRGPIEVVHPVGEHDFPPDVRPRAYAFLERALK